MFVATGDGALRPAWHDRGLLLVELRVEDLGGKPRPCAVPGTTARFSSADCTDSTGWPIVRSLDDVPDDGVELRVLGAVHQVGGVLALVLLVVGIGTTEVVGLVELRRLGHGGAGHAGELVAIRK